MRVANGCAAACAKPKTPHHLWLLRNSVFAALGGNDADARAVRLALKTSLESMFSEPEADLVSMR